MKKKTSKRNGCDPSLGSFLSCTEPLNGLCELFINIINNKKSDREEAEEMFLSVKKNPPSLLSLVLHCCTVWHMPLFSVIHSLAYIVDH